MRSILFIIMAISIISCGGNTSKEGTGNLEGFTVENVNGSDVKHAVKKNASGVVLEEGYLSNGRRNGMWITYYEDGENAGKIKSVASYSGGILNGPYLEFSTRGQIETEVNYANNQYNGRYAEYKFGRPEKISHYKDNQLDGVYQEFTSRGELQKEVNYKDGQQHGKMRYYNDEGQVVMEYEYKNGEKVSGGIVDAPDPE